MGRHPALTAIFLCDGHREVGLGHLSRSLGLAEALRRKDVKCDFAGRYDAAGRRLLDGASFSVGTRSQADESDVIVVDSYEVTADVLETLRAANRSAVLTIIDDFAALSRYPKNSLIINFTVGADELEYRGESLTVLRGPSYLLVREAITEQYGVQPRLPPERALVAIGGFDRTGVGAVAESVLIRAGLQADVVTGGARSDLACEYASADLCITGGGLTKYEAAYVGLPVAAIAQTRNEAEDTARFAAKGMCVDLGLAPSPAELTDRLKAFLDDEPKRSRLRDTARKVFRRDSTEVVASEVIARARDRGRIGLKDRDLRQVESHFSALAETYGHSPEAAQWSDVETQVARFARLVEIGDLGEAKVLDLGCGTGALLDYLVDRCDFKGQYVGYDLAEAALAIARERHPGARFERVDVSQRDEGQHETFDYALMSGVFNIRVSDNWDLMTSVITRIWPFVTAGLAFNLLSLYVDWTDDGLWYADPSAVFSFCKERLSPAVTLRHDYETRPGVVPYEFTVYVMRSEHEPRTLIGQRSGSVISATDAHVSRFRP